MSNNTNYLLKKLKDKVKPGKKSAKKIIEILSSELTLVEEDSSFVSPSYLNITKSNIVNCMLNEEKQLDTESLEIIIYKVIENESSFKYFNEIKATGQDYIVIFYEKNLGYFDSNSDLLKRKIWIKQGIDFYDYENNTLKLINYLSILDRCEENCL